MTERLRKRLEEALRRGVEQALAPHRRQHDALRRELEGLGDRVEVLRARLEAVECLLAPLGPGTPVHVAWHRPRVRRVLARHGLRACDRCPVGVDETLEELSFAYALDRDDFLRELGALDPC